MSRWFRHYAGMMRDEKLVSVAVRSKQPIERVVWIWGAILESAAEINDNGKFALDTAEVAYFLRAEQADLDCVIRVLEELGRIAGDRVVKWGDRQFSSDKSADRTRAYRDRQKGAGNLDQNVTQQGHDDVVTTSDADVTACDGHGDAPETETETETETEKKEKATAPNGAPSDPSLPEKQFFDRTVEILGPDGRSLGGKLLKSVGGNVALARSKLELSATKSNPRQWLAAATGPPRAAPQTLKEAKQTAWETARLKVRNAAYGTENSSDGSRQVDGLLPAIAGK